MKVLLVNPPEASQGGQSNPVLGLLYLASYVRDIVEVSYVDGFLEGWNGVWKKMSEFKPDVVGTSILTPARHSALRVLEGAKSRGATTVAGGPHATIMAEQIFNSYPYVDLIVKGEGEEAFRELLLDFTSPFRKRAIVSGREVDINSIPFPAWDLARIESNGYIGGSDIRVPIVSSRGCKGHCAFCSTWKFWKSYRVRSPENVVGEIEYIAKEFGKKHFVFEDDSLSCDLGTSKETMKLIAKKRLDVRFFATMRADGIDEELARLLKEAGCYGVSIGFESGSQRILDIMRKGVTVEQNISAAQTVKHAGLSLCALMVINSVGETNDTREASKRFLELIQPVDVGYLCEGLWILPGTYFYHKMKQGGFIDDSFWLGKEPCYYYRGELDYLYKVWRLTEKVREAI